MHVGLMSWGRESLKKLLNYFVSGKNVVSKIKLTLALITCF